jgi:hypothetical protein
MRLDPAIPQMEGMNLIDVKDGHDQRPFWEMNRLAQEKGAGWVDYWWPKPGSTTPSRIISYIKLCSVDCLLRPDSNNSRPYDLLLSLGLNNVASL